MSAREAILPCLLAEGGGTRTPPCVVFLHIPKTGGQTLNAILARQYEFARTVTIENPLGPVAPLREGTVRASPALVRGHIPFGIHEKLGIEPQYITMLRQPVDRVISMYRFIERYPKHPLHAQVHEQGMTLFDFVESGINRAEVDNGQTRQLAGSDVKDPDRDTLERAKNNLRSFLAVGLTERFDESVVLFRRRLHWKPPLYVSKNVASGGHRTGASGRTRELLEDHNHLDLELYRFAGTLFERQIKAAKWFTAEVAVFRCLNQLARAYKRFT